MLLNFAVLPAAIYLLIASICITNRMTKRTKHRKRLLVVGAGALAVFALARSVQFAWVLSCTNLVLAGFIIASAITMAFFPRVSV